jgi:predicted nucleic acid-binding Zn ribbon protein
LRAAKGEVHRATVIATKGKSFRMRKKGANEPMTEHEATSAALPKTGRKVGIKPPGGSVSDRRSGGASEFMARVGA